MKGVRVDILGKGTKVKETGEGKIYTVPVLLTFGCMSARDRLEEILRNAGFLPHSSGPEI
jgi:hypothetical protein